MAEKDNINEMDIDIDSEKKEVPEVVKEEKKENEEYEKFCFMCHRPESVAGKMIDLPNDICVCSDCMQKSFDMMNNNKFDLSQLMNMPGVQFLNLSDMENMIPKRQQVKKKKPEEKKAEPVFNIRDIPAPHKIAVPGWKTMQKKKNKKQKDLFCRVCAVQKRSFCCVPLRGVC